MLEVRIRPRAQLDLESLYIYLAVALKQSRAAESAVEGIYGTIDELARFPDMGRVIGNERLARPYRRMLSGNFWVLYSHDERELTVWRIVHTKRDIDDYTAVDF